MAYKSGEDLWFLSDDRSITSWRLWIARALIFFLWITPTRMREVSIVYSVGRLIGYLLIYLLTLRLLSHPTEKIEHEQSTGSDSKLIDVLSEEDVATRRELVQAALANSEYDDREECWEEFVRPFVDDHEHVEQLDDSGRRWKLINQ